jgi:phosphoribosylamine-glycine ligase
MNVNQKYVIVLGASYDQLYLIKNIKLLGLKIICIDQVKKSVGFKYSDVAIQHSFKDLKKIYKDLEKYRSLISGVITMGSDNPIIISKIAKRFNLKSISINTARICQNKIMMKRVFRKNKISSAKFIVTNSANKVKDFFLKNNLKKIVIKPSNMAGSRGVFALTNVHQIHEKVKELKEIIGKNRFIAEEYLDGPQISTESLIYNNKIITPGFADRNYLDTKSFLPKIIENGGSVPSEYFRLKSKIEKIILKIANVINFKFGVIKADIVINKNKIKVIEFAGRLSGGDFCESLVPLGSGVNYVKEAIKISINTIPSFTNLKVKKNKFVQNRYFFLPNGRLEAIKGIKTIKKYKAVKKLLIFSRIGKNIKPITSHSGRSGVFVVATNSRNNTNKLVDKIYKTVKFKINDKWFYGRP